MFDFTQTFVPEYSGGPPKITCPRQVTQRSAREIYKRGSYPHLEVPEISVEEFVRRMPTETALIRGGGIIQYHEGYEELSKNFASVEELLRGFKANKYADAAFPGYRYDQMYPKPKKTNYFKLNFGLKRTSSFQLCLQMKGGQLLAGT